MDAASLISSLVALERAASKSQDLITRDLVIEAQDWILRTQKENLELRRENNVLRQRYESLRREQLSISAHPSTSPIPATTLRKSRQVYGNDVEIGNQAARKMVSAV